jgi:hypothetical protein
MEPADLIAVGMALTASKVKAKAAEEDSPRFLFQEKLAVRTTDRVLVLDATRRQHATFLLPQEFRDRSVTFYQLDAGTALLTASRTLRDRRQLEELLWVDASGRVLQRAKASLGASNARYDQIEAWKSALAVPSPVVQAFLATVVVPIEYLEFGTAPNYSAAVARCLAAGWPPMLAVSLLAAALAWYCCRRHDRYYQSSSGLWFVFVLLTGVPGLVAYLFHRRWPVLEKCPACGQDVPRDREACANCGAAFPPPESKGCEVFA